MIDNLVQHLLEEISMDGEAGTDIARLDSFIFDYFKENGISTSHNAAIASSSTSNGQQQRIDPAFLSFVWDMLVAEEDVRVGVLRKPGGRLAHARTPTPEPTPVVDQKGEDTEIKSEGAASEAGERPQASGSEQQQEQPSQDDAAAEQSDQSAARPQAKTKGKKKYTADRKGKGKAKDRSPSTDDADLEMHELDDEQRHWSRDKLMETYGQDLMIAVGEQTAWVALTGSSMRPTSLTKNVYDLIQYVSRGRGEGATVVSIGRDLGIDQKSAFHFVRVAVNLGIVKKFRTIAQGCWTNRILHVRYLSISPHWAVFTASDDYEAEAAAAAGDNSADDDEAVARPPTVLRMSAIGRTHLNTNQPLVRSRIVRALKARDQHFMPYSQIASAIGLYNYVKADLRRLHALITIMVEQGILAKQLVTTGTKKKGDGGHQVQCVRLLDETLNFSRTGAGKIDSEGYDEDDEDVTPHMLALYPVEKQLLDLLVDAGEDGLVTADISQALGHLSKRTIDQLLIRVTRPTAVPAQFADFTLHAVTETVGREKRTRWFSAAGYLRRCAREGGFIDNDSTVRNMKAALSDECVGEWSFDVDDQAKTKATFYATPVERRRKVKGIDVRSGDKLAAGATNKKAGADPWKKIGQGAAPKAVAAAFPAAAPPKKRAAAGSGASAGRPKKRRASASGGEERAGGRGMKAKILVVDDGKGGFMIQRRGQLIPVPAAGSESEAVNDNAANDDDDNDGDDSDASAATQSKKKRGANPKAKGRPSAKPKPPGVPLTYYERRKLEDAERARKGLPPRPKRPSTGGGRRTKAQIAAMQEEKERKERERQEKFARGEPVSDPEPEPKKPTRKRKKKDAVATDAAEGEQATGGEAAEGTGTGTDQADAPGKVVKQTRARQPAKKKQKVPDEDEQSQAPAPSTSSAAAAAAAAAGDTAAAGSPPTTQTLAQPPTTDGPPPSAPNDVEMQDAERIASTSSTKPAEKAADGSTQAPPTASTPVPAPKKRGRPRKNPPAAVEEPATTPVATPADAAESTPTVAPKKRGRPRKSAAPTPAPPAATTAVEAFSTSPTRDAAKDAVPEASTSSSSPQRKRARLEPVVEIEVHRQSTATATPAANGATAVDSTPAPVEAESEAMPAEATPAPAASTPAAAPRSTLMPHPASQRAKSSHRPTATPKFNLSTLQRQHEIVNYMHHVGGIIENDFKTPKAVRDFIVEQQQQQQAAGGDQGKTIHLMDKKVFASVINSMVDRGVVKRTTVKNGQQERVDIVYLPAIALDSEEMTDFMRELSSRARQLRKRGGPVALEVAEDLSLPQTDLLKTEEMQQMDEPAAGDDLDSVRDFFSRNSTILGHQYGCYYGRVARARHLHFLLVDAVQKGEIGDVVVSKDSPNAIISRLDFFENMSLGNLVRIVPLPIIDADFQAYARDPNNASVLLKDLPRPIYAALALNTLKRMQALWPTIEVLVELGLVEPLVQVVSDTGAVSGYEAPVQGVKATHWRIMDVVPLYAFNRRDTPLIDVYSILTDNRVQEYWVQLQDAAFPSKGLAPERLTEEQSRDFALKFESRRGFAAKMSSSTKWHDQYLLLQPQRRYLTQVVEADQSVVERPDDIAKVASSVFAPPTVVKKYFKHVITSKTSTARQAGQSKRRKRPESGAAAAGVSEVRPRPLTQRRAVRQTKDARAHREAAFIAIVDRFKKQHADVEISQHAIDFLHDQFCPTRSRPIDSTQLDAELRLLLPNGRELVDASYRSIVPPAVLAKTNGDTDAVQVPVQRKPGFKGRKRGPIGVQVEPVDGAASPAAAAEGDEHEQEQEQEEEEHDEEGDDSGDAAFGNIDYSSNRQNEFLSEPAKEYPRLNEPSGPKRLPRNFFTEEQVELLLDAAAILQARADRLGMPAILWRSIKQLFSDVPAEKMRTRLSRTLKEPSDLAYFRRLVQNWSEVWKAKVASGELKDDHPKVYEAFDLPEHVHCLRKNVDKHGLRLAGPTNPAEFITTLPAVKLPSSLEELRANFLVEEPPTSAFDTDRWSEYWRSTVATTTVDHQANAAPFATSSTSFNSRAPAVDHQVEMAANALKLLTLQNATKYTADLGVRFLEPYEAKLAKATARLEELDIINRQGKAGRRLPGRGYDTTYRFHMAFNDSVTPLKAQQAAALDEHLHDDEDYEWPLIAKDGQMMGLLHRISEGTVTLEPDLEPTADLRDPNDYQTRQKDDESIECSVFVRHSTTVHRTDASDTIMPPDAPHEDYIDDAEALRTARTKLVSDGSAVNLQAGRMLDVVCDGGVDGVPAAQLALKLDASEPSYIEKLASILTSYTPPLAFWAGDARPSLISSEFLSQWTVETVKYEMKAPSDGRTASAGLAGDKDAARAPTEVPVRASKGRDSTGLEKRQRRAPRKSVPVLTEDDDRNGSTAMAEAGPIDFDLEEEAKLKGLEIDGESIEKSGKRVFPAVWRDINGEVRTAVWKHAVSWVKSMLVRHAGSTVVDLFARAQTYHHLSLLEIMLLVQTLERAKVVKRRSANAIVSSEDDVGRRQEQDDDEDAEDGDESLGWEEAHFYLTDAWITAA